MDKESWFSVTPEILSEYLSNRIGYRGIILDLFAGTGGNSIQFAKMGNYVISCDKDFKKIECLKNNSKIYGVDKNIGIMKKSIISISNFLSSSSFF